MFSIQHPIKHSTFALLTAAFLVLPPAGWALDNDRLLAEITGSDRPNLVISPVVSGTVWNPRGLQPYDLDAYPRSYIGVELGLHNPLRILHHEANFLQIPSLSVESNLGMHESDLAMPELTSANRDLPKYRVGIWIMLFDYLSIRYQAERFATELTNPTMFFFAPGGGNSRELENNYQLRAENTYRNIEVGLIGTPDGEDWDTIIEAGYFNMRWEQPVVVAVGGVTSEPTLYLPQHYIQGFYVNLSSEPIELQWPVHTKLGARVGKGPIWTSSSGEFRSFVDSDELLANMLQLDLRLTFERPVKPWLFLGGAASAQWRLIVFEYSPGGTNYNTSINESYTRFGITLFTRFSLDLPGQGVF